MKKKVLIIICSIIAVSVLLIYSLGVAYAKDTNIDEVLKTKSYSSLSVKVKKFIKKYYEENGVILLTKDLAKDGEAYLNPKYIEYLDSDNKETYYAIPSITAYVPKIVLRNNSKSTKGIVGSSTLPSRYDLRDVDGKNFVTPNKNQGNEGLCWAYATASLLETHDLITKNKSYDNSAKLFSEKQMDYALSTDGIIGGNKVMDKKRSLSSGAYASDSIELLAERLGGVYDSWNRDNALAISVDSQIEPSVVFDRSNVIYEVGETTKLYDVGENSGNALLDETYRNVVKNAIMNNGGALIAIGVAAHPNSLKVSDYLNLNIKEYISRTNGYHGIHLIGWDDDYEYGFCSNYISDTGTKFVSYTVPNANGEYVCDITPDSQFIRGKGAWIAKNSWGSAYSYLYIPYESLIDEFETIDSYTTQEWDNSYKLHRDYKNTIGEYYDLKKINYVEDETATLLKIYTSDDSDFNIYYSANGPTGNYTLIESVDNNYAGFKSIDLSSKNISITKDSVFRFNSNGVRLAILFTTNNDTIPKASTKNFIYNLSDDKPSVGNYFEIAGETGLKNVSDNIVINYKIKYAEGDYLPNNAYTISSNKSYYNMVNPSIKIKDSYAKKGTYQLETWNGDALLSTSIINLAVDFMPIDGDGSEDNPWKIRNTRHMNMIRNASDDSFILMNDIDFDYDINDPNGLFDGYWPAITMFKGDFDGNGKTIKNIAAPDGIFYYVAASDEYCKFSECGVHDLKVDTLINSYSNYQNGGIISHLSYDETYKYNFSNLSLVNAKFNSIYSPIAGGIVGLLWITDNTYNMRRTVFKINNWYADVTFSGTDPRQQEGPYYMGGLIGSLYANDTAETIKISLNNVKTNVHFDLSNDLGKEYHISDIIGNVSLRHTDLYINNAISNVSYKYNNGANVSFNAITDYYVNEDGTSEFKVNGSKSTLNYTPNNMITVTNSEFGLKPYQMARATYDSIYHEDKYYVYNQSYGTTTPVLFTDRFNVYGNKIPTLKKFSEDYSNYVSSYAINVGETISINDLIENDTNYRKLNVYTTFECNYDFCNNATDETIISISNAQNEYTISGLKKGKTSLIFYDEISGYLNSVNITVLDEDEYKLTLDSNYGNSSNSVISIKTGMAYGELPTPERDGYTFLGWFTESVNGEKINSNSIFNGNSDATIYAHWQKNPVYYTVTFATKEGSNVESQSVLDGGKVTRPDDPTKSGYIFKHWNLQGAIYDFNTPVNSDITLVAVWEEKTTATVTFDSDGAGDIPSQTVLKKGTIIEPPIPIKAGYKFVHWVTANGAVYDFSTPVTQDMTLKAFWVQYPDLTVKFISFNQVISSTKVKYNGKLQRPTDPTKDGYTFKGWLWNQEPYDFDSLVIYNMELNASWEIKKYTVTFDTAGGNNIPSQEVSHDFFATRPTDPTRDGYTFKGWKLNGNTFSFSTRITSNITLTATWEKIQDALSETLQNNSYTVTNNLVTGFTVGKTVQEIKTQLGNDIVIETNNSVISTGAVIKKNNESFTVVVKGDLTGDGRINSGDLLQMRKHLLEDVILTGAYKEAGIIESNGNIKSLDLLRLRQYLLGDYTFR